MDALFLVWFLLVATITPFLSGEHVVDVRLVNGPSRYEGTVEYTTDNVKWQTTCGVNFDFHDARLVCEHIGANGTNKAITNSPFGSKLAAPTTFLYCLEGNTDISDCPLYSSNSCSTTVIGAAICYDENFLGCYKDERNNYVLNGDPLNMDTDMTIDNCISHCRESTMADYVYAGVENGNECYCGVAGADYSRDGAAQDGDEDCQSQCAGDAYSSCGGVDNIAVFQIPERSQPVTSPKIVIVTTEDADTSSVLTSNTIVTDSTTTDDTPLPSTTPAVTRQVENTSDLDLTSNKHETGSATPVDTSLSSTTPTVTRLVGNASKLGVTAGAGGGVAAIVIIIVVIIVAVVLYKRRHGRATDKAPIPDQPPDKFDANNYDEIRMEITLDGRKPIPHHPYEDCVNYAVVNKKPQVNIGPAKNEEDLSALYAVSTKHRPEPEGAELGDLYAMPDKRKKSHVNLRESTPPVTDALYAMPDKKKNVTDDGDEDGTEMVDNPIYS